MDDLYDQGSDNQMVYDSLQGMLKNAKSDTEKSEVLWRLSRVCVDLGDKLDEKDKNAKFAIYTEGENYAIQSIEAHPNYLAYLWKCANIGRYGQTKGVMDSLAKVKPMKADIRVITDDFNVVDSSETWYTLGILQNKVPDDHITHRSAETISRRCTKIPHSGRETVGERNLGTIGLSYHSEDIGGPHSSPDDNRNVVREDSAVQEEPDTHTAAYEAVAVRTVSISRHPLPSTVFRIAVAQGQMVGRCESLGLDPQRDFFRKTEQLLTFESELVTPPRGTYVIARPRQNVEPSSFHLEQAGLVARTVDKIGIYRRDQ